MDYVGGDAASQKPEPLPEPTHWQSGAEPDCFLCRAAADFGGDNEVDRRLLVVRRGPLALVMLNRFPYNNGHLMVAPLRHVGELVHVSRDESTECMEWLARLTAVLGDRLQAEGFNIGLNLGRVAGAGLPGHLHWHLVPRWQGDSNFMTAVADTRVIPQSLDALWEVLDDAFQ